MSTRIFAASRHRAGLPNTAAEREARIFVRDILPTINRNEAKAKAKLRTLKRRTKAGRDDRDYPTAAQICRIRHQQKLQTQKAIKR